MIVFWIACAIPMLVLLSLCRSCRRCVCDRVARVLSSSASAAAARARDDDDDEEDACCDDGAGETEARRKKEKLEAQDKIK